MLDRSLIHVALAALCCAGCVARTAIMPSDHQLAGDGDADIAPWGDAARGDARARGGDTAQGDSTIISDAEHCMTAGYECGDFTLQEQGVPRVVQCGLCTQPLDCGGGGIPNMCGCTPETDNTLCASFVGACGWHVVEDDCGVQRHIDCAGVQCLSGEVCGAGAAFTCSPVSSAAWSPVGDSEFVPVDQSIVWGSAEGSGISGNIMDITDATVALAPDGYAVAMWVSRASRLFVLRWDGVEWVRYPDLWSWISGRQAAATRMALMPDGAPIVVAHDLITGEVHLRRWSGTLWEQLAGSDGATGISNTAGASDGPSIAVDSTGDITVVWRQAVATEYEIYLRQWDGVAWRELGGSASGGGLSNTGGALQAAVALQSDGIPVVAWTGYNGNGVPKQYVKRWTGVAWEELASSATGSGVSGAEDAEVPALAVDSQDRISVAWSLRSARSPIHLRRWDGVAWQALGTSATSGVLMVPVQFQQFGTARTFSGVELLSDDRPCLVGSADGDDLVVRCWDGAAWSDIGSLDRAAGVANGLDIDANDTMFVHWISSGHDEVSDFYGVQWDGAGWQQLGGLSTVPSISNSPADSGPSQVAFDLRGLPVVGWGEAITKYSGALFARRWTGASWAEMAGSASDTSFGLVSHRQLALASDAGIGLTAAWSASVELRVRRWDGVAWQALGDMPNVSTGSTLTRAARVAVRDNTTAVAWLEQAGSVFAPSGVMLRQWDGVQWLELDGSGTFPGIDLADEGPFGTDARFRRDGIALALTPGGAPVVAWSSTGFQLPYLRRWTGSFWEELSGSASGGGVFGNGIPEDPAPTLAVDSGGQIVMGVGFWNTIEVSRWNGSAWLALPRIDRFAVGGGVPGHKAAPALAMTPADEPVIVYTFAEAYAAPDPVSAIYLQVYRGGGWQGVAGSAAGFGISNSPSRCFNPSIAMRGSVACVTWNEVGKDAQQVLMRCLDLQ